MLRMSIKCFISAFIMFIVVKIITNFLPVGILNTCIEILIGGIVYIVVLLILKYEFLKELTSLVINAVRGKIKCKN
jgi:hypothetical protein